MMIGAAADSIWRRCATALGRPEWGEDERFKNRQVRMKNRPFLEAELEKILSTNTTVHWIEVLDEAGVPCGPVQTYDQLFNQDTQVKHREMVIYAEDEELGSVPHIRTPIKMGDKIAVRRVAPKLGEHNAEVLARVGVSAEELAALKTKGVV